MMDFLGDLFDFGDRDDDPRGRRRREEPDDDRRGGLDDRNRRQLADVCGAGRGGRRLRMDAHLLFPGRESRAFLIRLSEHCHPGAPGSSRGCPRSGPSGIFGSER